MEYAPFSVETCNEKVTSECFYTHSMRYFYLLIILRLIKNKINKSNLKPKIENLDLEVQILINIIR